MSPETEAPCLDSAFVIKNYLIDDKGVDPERIRFKSVRGNGDLIHIWTELDGLIVDELRFRQEYDGAGLRISLYRFGSRDTAAENLWDRLSAVGLSEELRAQS